MLLNIIDRRTNSEIYDNVDVVVNNEPRRYTDSRLGVTLTHAVMWASRMPIPVIMTVYNSDQADVKVFYNKKAGRGSGGIALEIDAENVVIPFDMIAQRKLALCGD